MIRVAPIAVLVVACGFSLIDGAPAANAKDAAAAVEYLTKYGYLVEKDPRSGALRTEKELVDGIKLFQRYAGQKESGVIDADTLAWMGKDRCGVADFSKTDSARRKRRYTLQGSVWRRKDLTYKIKGYSSKVARDKQRATFRKAFQMWQDASQLSFRETNSDNADILIDFKRSYHNDGYPFDGRGGTLAHAFYPHTNKGISGDAHFDSEENWTVGGGGGVDLEWVAIHEFGHSLGLGHSRTRGSIMYPWYQGYKANIQLTVDDLGGIRALYGRRDAPATEKPTAPPQKTRSPSKPRPTRNPSMPDACTTSFDAFFMDARQQKTYALKGYYYWVISSNPSLESGPHKIDSRWRAIRQPVDAAYTRNDGKTVFFVGSQYYIYKDQRLESGPRHIRDYGLPDALSNMDAVFIWGGNGVTYFFKGDQYWRYDDRVRKVSIGYPRKINGPWKGVPSNVDAAMKWRNGITYFFKNRNYYRLVDRPNIKVDYGYPKITGLAWMKCARNEIKADDGEHSSASSVKPRNATKSHGTKEGEKSSGNVVLSSLTTLGVSMITLFKLYAM